MAREKIQLQAGNTNQSLNKTNTKRSDKGSDEFKLKRMQNYNSTDLPDPDILRKILE